MASGIVNISVSQLRETEKMLTGIRNGTRNAIMGAVNETVKEEKTYISTQIRKRVAIKKKDIDPHIHIRHASKTNLSGHVRMFEAQRISLRYFGARQVAAGVTYKIDKRGGKKLKRSAFMGPRPGATAIKLRGHAFIRVMKSQYPIVKLHGPSAWGVFVKSGLEKLTIDDVKQRLEKNLAQRVNYLVLRHQGKI